MTVLGGLGVVVFCLAHGGVVVTLDVIDPLEGGLLAGLDHGGVFTSGYFIGRLDPFVVFVVLVLAHGGCFTSDYLTGRLVVLV